MAPSSRRRNRKSTSSSLARGMAGVERSDSDRTAPPSSSLSRLSQTQDRIATGTDPGSAMSVSGTGSGSPPRNGLGGRTSARLRRYRDRLRNHRRSAQGLRPCRDRPRGPHLPRLTIDGLFRHKGPPPKQPYGSAIQQSHQTQTPSRPAQAPQGPP